MFAACGLPFRPKPRSAVTQSSKDESSGEATHNAPGESELSLGRMLVDESATDDTPAMQSKLNPRHHDLQ